MPGCEHQTFVGSCVVARLICPCTSPTAMSASSRAEADPRKPLELLRSVVTRSRNATTKMTSSASTISTVTRTKPEAIEPERIAPR